MPLRPFEDSTPKPDEGAPDFANLPTPEEFKDLPPELAQALLKPIVKAALDAAVHELIEAAEAAIKEERTLGQPGPKWDALLDLIADRTKIDKDDKLRIILVTRLVFLLVAARNLLPPGTDIDPNTTEFRD